MILKMELKKLIIAFLAAYIIYCFMSKENYAFDEPEVVFPKNDPNVGYVDIYHKKEKSGMVLSNVEFSPNIASGKATIILHKPIEKDRDLPTVSVPTVIINGFTKKTPTSVLGYGVFYNKDKNVAAYRPMTFINATNIQVMMKPGKELMIGNLSPGNLGSQSAFSAFKDGELIHTGRFVFTF